MDICIDMLNVGNGDSITIWIRDGNESLVIVLDGGPENKSERLINHLDERVLPAANKSAPDIVISTHTDQDHIGGLIPLIHHYQTLIGNVLVHDPAMHAGVNMEDAKRYLSEKSDDERYQLILNSLDNLSDLIKAVDNYGINRVEPFSDDNLFNSFIRILSPSRELYESMLPNFRDLDNYYSSEAKEEYAAHKREELTILDELFENSDNPCPTVDENNETSAENETSVVLEVLIQNQKYVFTGDAGVRALTEANHYYGLDNIHWLDIPHHGSRRNLTSDLINIMNPDICFVSAAGNGKHPRKALIDCLKRHGTTIYGTHKSGNLQHRGGSNPPPLWDGYINAEPL